MMKARHVTVAMGLMGLVFCPPYVRAATRQDRYFAHPTVEDAHGVIAPWYKGQNGQCDLRVRVAAETMKRYPWTTADRLVGIAPEYAFNSGWRISADGAITVPPMDDWMCGDRGQMCARAMLAWVEYYRYTGDPAAMAHVEVVGNALLDHNLTDANHPWPRFLISVPVKGKPYGPADPKGWIQLDIAAEAGVALLRAYQLCGNRRFFDAARHWGDVLANRRDPRPGAMPWPRYANPEQVKWGKDKTGNVQTGGIVYQLAMLDELIRLGYTGAKNEIVEARDAGRQYVREKLLPQWTVNDTWGRNYWDWEDPVQAQTTTDWATRYLMDHSREYPNWKTDVRNILTLFMNHTGVNPASRGEVYSGAWALPESSGCCEQSLSWGPMELAVDFAQYAAEAESRGDVSAATWAREVARRMQIFATYDVHETGVVEDSIDGGVIAAGSWFKGTHPSAMKWVLRTMAWMPDVFGPCRENHIMRSTSVVNRVVYADGRIVFSTYDAPEHTVSVLRLAFEPCSVTTPGGVLERRADLKGPGYTTKALAGGDWIVSIRHDGHKGIVVEGDDPQMSVDDARLDYEGEWASAAENDALGGTLHSTIGKGSGTGLSFEGNQVRVIGSVGPEGGQAEVCLDGVRQRVGIDFWNPRSLHQQVIYYRNGLSQGRHTLKIVATGSANPLSAGNRLWVDAVAYSAAEGKSDYGQGGGPTGPQRMIFGYAFEKNPVDSRGNTWLPGTEWMVRSGAGTDSVAQCWWTSKRAATIAGTSDPALYQYGVHAKDFTVNITVGPGRYDVRLRFAETEHAEAGRRLMAVFINDERRVEDLDVFSKAGGAGKALDLEFKNVAPKNGIVEVRLTGGKVAGQQCEAMIQALEVLPAP